MSMDFILSKEKYHELMELGGNNAVILLLYLLDMANDEGMLSVGIRTISDVTGIGLQSMRTLLKKMYLTHLLTHQATHQGSTITICNIDSYKCAKKRANTPANTPTNTPKQTIEERKKEFADKLKPHLEKYGNDMLNNFYQYWTQVNDGGVKMLYERQKAFQIPNRLATWRKNNYGSHTGGMDTGIILRDSRNKDYKKGGW